MLSDDAFPTSLKQILLSASVAHSFYRTHLLGDLWGCIALQENHVEFGLETESCSGGKWKHITLKLCDPLIRCSGAYQENRLIFKRYA